MGGSITESWLGVPIPAGDRVIGVIGLESTRPYAYSESDERVLATLSSSMGVALENARLFAETRRLLAEADERAAELAIINGIQQGLAAQLDMQSMYDLVGDKLQEIFDAQVVDIGIYRLRSGRHPLPVRDRTRRPLSRRALAIHRRDPRPHRRTRPRSSSTTSRPGSRSTARCWSSRARPSKSLVRVPMIVGGDVRGTISLQNLDRTHAFSEATFGS